MLSDTTNLFVIPGVIFTNEQIVTDHRLGREGYYLKSTLRIIKIICERQEQDCIFLLTDGARKTIHPEKDTSLFLVHFPNLSFQRE